MSKERSSGGKALWRVPVWFPELSSDILQQLERYHGELLKFNARINLISRATETESDEVHVADSILAVNCLPHLTSGTRVFDFGSGNGLPGVILAILRPDLEVVPVDSDSRKCEFIKSVASTLKLPNVRVLNSRVENIGPADVAVTRGLASISRACELCSGLFHERGRVFHLKSANWSAEVDEMSVQLRTLWSAQLAGEYQLPVSGIRRAVVCTTKLS